MIRRDLTNADGSPAWVLISQIEHAHLAGELAAGWGDGWPEGVLPTIFRHDDGWRQWERAPTIDPEQHRPRSFLEMPTAAALEIWRKSIASVAELGPLAQFMVAEHFCRLRRGAGASDEPEVDEFLRDYSEHCRVWLTQWQSVDRARNTPAAAELAVDWLQFFDRFSLWLCMAERTAADALTLPGGASLSLSPAPVQGNRQTIGVAPWPWTSDAHELVIRGRIVPARPLADDQALRDALAAATVFERQFLFRPL